MAFKLTYSDGQESEYGDDTVWEVDDGVLKLGKKEGRWSVLLSPSHWAVIELDGAKSRETDGKDEGGSTDESDDAKDRDAKDDSDGDDKPKDDSDGDDKPKDD
ncbi:hypothetical protein ACFQWH_26505 [Mycolicibacterium sp. GCM10028919]|uniref:hypothetical protein n=1 Tax=Mycolicibacterium sp. GCM10028919 TaxID=3273401 RepID=UPI00360D45F2